MQWINDEPVRATFWPLITLLTTFLLTKGYIDNSDVDFILGAASIILGTMGVEIARSQVSPVKP